MKKSSKLFGLLLLFAVVFVSCSSDDHEDPKERIYFNGTATVQNKLTGQANAFTSTTYPAIPLEKILPIGTYSYISPIVDGEFTSVTAEIVGLKEGCDLMNFSLTINKENQKWDDNDPIGHNKSDLYSNKTHTFFNNVFNSMLKQQSLTITVSYAPTLDISDSDNAMLIIKYKGRFAYERKL